MLAVTISGVTVAAMEGTLQTHDTIDGRSVASVNIKDLTGTQHYQPGQPVTITDTNYSFTGFVNDSAEKNLTPNAALISTVTAIDGAYIPGKRFFVGPEYQNRYAGDIAIDLVSRELAAEGITANYAATNTQTVADWSTGSLTNVVSANNTNGGDLELAPAGSQVEVIETTTSDFASGTLTNVTASSNSLILSSTPVLQFQCTASVAGAASNSLYIYQKIWSGSVLIASGDNFIYDIWIDPASPEQKFSMFIICTDGTIYNAANGGGTDAQGIFPEPTNDLTGLATGMWYSRKMGVASPIVGKTISYAVVACAGSKVGNYNAFFRGAFWYSVSSTVKATFFNTTLAIATPNVTANNGFSSSSVSVQTGYQQTGNRVSSTHSIDAAKIVRSSFMSYDLIQPTGTNFTLETSFDGGSTWQLCTNDTAIPNLLAGANVTSKNIQFRETLTTANPLVTPVLSDVTATINTSYAMTKTDVSLVDTLSSGTLTNLVFSGGSLSLNGFTRNWDNADYSNQTVFGTNSPFQGITNRQIYLSTSSSTGSTWSQLNFAGQYTNFSAQVDITFTNLGDAFGIMYRTTNWVNGTGRGAYYAEVNPNSGSSGTITLNKGTNSGSTSVSTTLIATSSNFIPNVQANSIHRLKVVVSGNTHNIYFDDVLFLTTTDSSFSGSGYIGLVYFSNGGSQIGYFDNFGVAATLSGTRVSSGTSIASVGTYGNSVIQWQAVTPNACTILVESSVDGGSTYQTCTNGGAIPNLTLGQSLSGKSVQTRVTLTAGDPSVFPSMTGLSWSVIGQYSASGSRISQPLSLANVGRAGSTLVSWSANQPANTTIAIDTSLDNSTWTQIGTGAVGSGQIAGINVQSDPVVDQFTSNTSSNYTSTYQTGGSLATWTWDTTNSRLVASGGSNAILLYNSAVVGADVDISAIMDASDRGGFIWRYQDQSNFYFLAVHDNSASSNPSTIQLFKVVAGTSTQIGGNATINFVRTVPHTIRVTVIGSSIIAYYDGSSVLTQTDTSISNAGFCGVRNNTNSAQYYLFRLQFFGDDVTSKQSFTRIRLTTTDPTATPQITDISMSARNSNIQSGALIPQTSYSILNGNKTTLAQIFDDLAKQSGNFWWKIIGNQFVFQAHQTVPAPFVITGSDVLVSNIGMENIADNYRDSQWITSGTDIIPQTRKFIGDGVSTTFDVGFPIDSVTSITLNNVVELVGIQNADTGRDWYYSQGSSSIVQDASEQPLNDTQTLVVAFNAQVNITVNVKRNSEITRMALRDGTTGIIEEAEDANGLTKSGMIVKADGLLTQYAVDNKTAKFRTLRSGLAVGQLVSMFVSPFGLFDGTFLITDVQTSWRLTAQNGTVVAQRFYDIQGVSGPIVGDWTRFIVNLGK